MPTEESANEEYIDNSNTGSDHEEEVQKSSGADVSNIAGCSFSVYPMNDRYVELIESALEMVNMSKVWNNTDDVSTVVRGRLSHVFDVSKAVFLHTAKTGEHVTLRATYSIGCPGDNIGEAYMAQNDEPVNASSTDAIDQNVSVKFALYPLGGNDYMDAINRQIEAMKETVEVTESHYETRLDGDANDIFDGLEKAFRETGEAGSSHTVMTVTMVAHNEDTP